MDVIEPASSSSSWLDPLVVYGLSIAVLLLALWILVRLVRAVLERRV